MKFATGLILVAALLVRHNVFLRGEWMEYERDAGWCVIGNRAIYPCSFACGSPFELETLCQLKI